MKKYDIIYCDPPWDFSQKYKSNDKVIKSINDFYPTFKDPEAFLFFKEKIKPIANDNAVIFMWTTDSNLETAIKCGNFAGFRYTTVAFIWMKKHRTGGQVVKMSMWTMKCAEICLLFTKGRMHNKLLKRNVRQLVEAERREHSRKPDEVRDRIVDMFGSELSKVELFARQETKGWDVFGNEVSDSIQL